LTLNRGGHAPAHQQGKPKRQAAIASFIVFALKLAVSNGLAAYKLAQPARYCADVSSAESVVVSVRP
jgi:hypothetical protein